MSWFACTVRVKSRLIFFRGQVRGSWLDAVVLQYCARNVMSSIDDSQKKNRMFFFYYFRICGLLTRELLIGSSIGFRSED